MNPHFLNGERLLRVGRANEAADAFRQSLSTDPHDAQTHALLALALQQAKDEDGALAAAHEAARLDPGQSFSHYVLAFMSLVVGNTDQAERSANEALRLEPNVPEYHRLLAMVWMARRKWAEALTAVDRGLAVDPEHTDCLNLRSQVLMQLGRRAEARGVASAALASDPDDAHSHANAGWAALHNNKTREALGHFKESLRLDPGNDWAKAGLAEALKARNPLYRLLLGFMLWMIRLDPRVRMGVIIGGFILYRLGSSYAEKNPDVAPYVWPLLIAYMVFAWMTWLGVPLADLVLRLSPYGRHALSDRQRLVSSVLGLSILAVAGFACTYLITDESFFFLAAVQLAALALISVGVLQSYRAPRYQLLLGGCWLLVLFMLVSWLSFPLDNDQLFDMGHNAFLYGFIGMMWFVALGGAGTPRSTYS